MIVSLTGYTLMLDLLQVEAAMFADFIGIALLSLISLLWIVANVFGLWSWFLALQEARHTLKAQREAHENGILEYLATRKIYEARYGVVIATSNLIVIVGAFLLPQPYKMIVGRLALTIAVVVFGWMGVAYNNGYKQLNRMIRHTLIRHGELPSTLTPPASSPILPIESNE